MNMEASAKDQAASSAGVARNSSSKLRYPLRPVTAKREKENPSTPETSKSSASKPKAKSAESSVSKRMGVLNVPGKATAGMPPRRLSVPNKSTTGPVSKPIGCNTLVSEVRVERSVTSGDGSKLSIQRKFNLLSSPSYWLSQIKNSEAHAMHSVSLGFFNLAVEAGCEDIQRMRDELKSYTHRHGLVEHGEHVKDLFDKYDISESLQASETCSHVPDKANRSSDDDARNYSSTGPGGNRELKPKSPNAKVQAPPVMQRRKKLIPQKHAPENKTRGLWARNSVNSKVVPDTKGLGRPVRKKAQKSIKKGSNKEKDEASIQGNNSDEGPINILATEGLQENKENVVVAKMEENGGNEE